ncbi:glutathione S-transferase family protein [Microvirga roseola]|uniref:glutathione S-transferase family protein n=1 Tax=Microvirga roseola TaxID=2883126 RepID=UPI001E4B63B2|nr:glutathione S-transferase [Microvirga roseola]
MLTIWGRKNSIKVQKVLWCCGEIGLNFRRIDAGREFGINDTPEFLQLNPNGLVPTIEDDGFVLWESNVIVRYLATKHRAHVLYPPDLRSRFDVERWMDWHATTLWPTLRPVFFGLIRTPPEQRDHAMLRKAQIGAEQAFGILVRHHSDRPYVTGETFTIGDIPLGIAAFRWYALDIARPVLPSLDAWYHRLRERPAFQANVAGPLS